MERMQLILDISRNTDWFRQSAVDSGPEPHSWRRSRTRALTIPLLNFGMVQGWLSPMMTLLQSVDTPSPEPYTKEDLSWVASVTYITAIVFGAPMGYLTDRYGRKAMTLALTLSLIVYWLIKICCLQPWALILARAVAGIPCSACYIVLPIYLKEISDIDLRGALGSLLILSRNVGYLISYICANLMDVKALFWLSIMVPCVTFLLFLGMPETPEYLIKQGKVEEAKAVLAWLRGVTLVDKTLEEDIEKLVAAEKENKAELKSAWRVILLSNFIISAIDFHPRSARRKYHQRHLDGLRATNVRFERNLLPRTAIWHRLPLAVFPTNYDKEVLKYSAYSFPKGRQRTGGHSHRVCECAWVTMNSGSRTLSDKNTSRAFIITVVIKLAQQFDGYLIVLIFAGQVFESASETMHVHLGANTQVILVGVVQLLGSILATCIVEKTGRKCSGKYFPSSISNQRQTSVRSPEDDIRLSVPSLGFIFFQESNEHVRHQSARRRSSPPIDTRNPKGVASASPACWI
ncbi:Facilitated trehalose transporter Tret1 [Eumeta japonica]|uniref:Facilitated trehalose transporter Tret1 n=1 Tax=Eumeta variegata TaxID=151549 RepID=A0A4C1V4R3_EUMVA|nr:Facilitated trehalose transporter Tret1 [Eumeta japonica]